MERILAFFILADFLDYLRFKFLLSKCSDISILLKIHENCNFALNFFFEEVYSTISELNRNSSMIVSLLAVHCLQALEEIPWILSTFSSCFHLPSPFSVSMKIEILAVSRPFSFDITI